MTPCSRCQRTDGTHVGYHEERELPFQRGDRVRIRAGAILLTTLPDPARREIVNKRSRVITVHSVHNGMSRHVGYGPNLEDRWQHLDEPQVVWPGSGGYWHRAKMSDCEMCPVSCVGSVGG